MIQLELFEEMDNTRNRAWFQIDAKIQSEFVTRLGQLLAKTVQEKEKRSAEKEDEHDNLQ